eukprot:jgi/Pico_ML_1/54967/g97.t1
MESLVGSTCTFKGCTTRRRNTRTNVTVTRATKVVRETDPKKRIVITGMGLVSCFGNDYEKFYDELLGGKSGVIDIDRFDASAFPTRFAAQIQNFDNEGLIDAKNDRRLDAVLRYGLVAGNKALADAGLDAAGQENLDKTRAGMLISSGMGGITVFQDGVTNLVQKGYKRMSPFFIPYAITNMGGDMAEVAAIQSVFTQRSHMKMNATKSMIGHCLGAAGGLEAIATIQAIKTGYVHPSLNQDDLEEGVDIDTVVGAKQAHDITVGISNSFGFGGHNSVVAFAPYVE